MTKKGMSHYLTTKAPTEEPKYPVGKIAGKDSHSYNGSSIMHVLWQNNEGEWRLLCKPKKLGVYSYRGFRAAIQCPVCLKRRDKPESYPSESKSRPPSERSSSNSHATAPVTKTSPTGLV